MSIFRKSEDEPQRQRERAVLPARGNGDGAISIIGPGMTVEGDVVTQGTVRVEGELRGTIRAAKAVIVGRAGRIDGTVVTDDAVIGGYVEGIITVRRRLELQSTSVVTGEIHARAEGLKLEEGARFTGNVQMLEEDGLPELEVAPELDAARDGSDNGRAGTSYPRPVALGSSPDDGDPFAAPDDGSIEDESLIRASGGAAR